MRAVVLCALGVIGGCSLFTPLDGFITVEGDDAGASIDAALDAPVDGSSESSGSAGSAGCLDAGVHAFCADFDRVAIVSEGWSELRTTTGGSGTLEDALFVSPPRSALLRIPANSPACTYAKLQRGIPGSFTKATLSFDFRIGTKDNTVAPPSNLSAGLGIGGTCHAFISPFGTNAGIYRQDDPSGSTGKLYTATNTSTLGAGTWHRIRLSVSTTEAPYILLESDGTVVRSVDEIPNACKGAGDVWVSMGFHCMPSSTVDYEMRADNVVVDTP